MLRYQIFISFIDNNYIFKENYNFSKNSYFLTYSNNNHCVILFLRYVLVKKLVFLVKVVNITLNRAIK